MIDSLRYSVKDREPLCNRPIEPRRTEVLHPIFTERGVNLISSFLAGLRKIWRRRHTDIHVGVGPDGGLDAKIGSHSDVDVGANPVNPIDDLKERTRYSHVDPTTIIEQ